MNNSKKECSTRASLLISGMVAALLSACGSGGGAGAVCVEHGDCASSYQCLSEVCVDRCQSHIECGDGFRCSDNGICNVVRSQIGDLCNSEFECGIQQSCQLDPTLVGPEQFLGSTCQPQDIGFNVGANCLSDSECLTGICSIGHCSQVCEIDSDCPTQTGCTVIPQLLTDGSAFFKGCLQNSGVLTLSVEMDSSKATQRIQIPVPQSAKSFALVATVESANHDVGARKVVSPSGLVLFPGEFTFEEQSSSSIRHVLKKRTNTLLVPNRDTLSLETGFYQIDVGSSIASQTGAEAPKVTVFYKMDSRRVLDLHFYLMNLEDHPCKAVLGSKTLNAKSAITSAAFQEQYLANIRRILEDGGLQIGTITYTDVDQAHLDAIVDDGLERLFPIASNETGIAIFLVRSLSSGVQAKIGGTPGPPRSPGTTASGVAISMDTLCYRSWESLARVTGHSVAGQMGLWNNRDPQGITDPISDSVSSSDNLMFFGEFGGETLSEGQKKILGLYPGLR